MFETEEDKFLYLVGCALNGTAASSADIPKLTKQAFGIAEAMLSLINESKQSADCAPLSFVHGASQQKLEGKVSRDLKDSKYFKDSKDSKDTKSRDVKAITGDLPGKAPELAKPLKSTVLPVFMNKAANLHAGAGAAAKDALALKEPIKLDDLASHDKGWNYTPWGKS
jgi:hypothetical protein